MWKLFLFCLLFYHSHGALDSFKMPTYGSALVEAITDIIVKFYKDKSRTVNIVHAFNYDKDSEQLEDSIDEFLYLLKDEAIVQLEDYSSLKISKRKRIHNIIFCDGYESFENVFNKIDPDIFEYQGFYLIVIAKYSNDLYKTMSKIFESMWSLKIINVDVLWMPAEIQHEAMLYTFYPYTSFYCGKAYPVQINQYHRSGKWHNEPNFFPNKMKNLFGCSLRVATFTNAPFTIVSEQNGHVSVGGIEGILLRVLSQRMNFKVEFLIVEDVQWGEIFMNGTTTGENVCLYQIDSQFSCFFRCHSNDNAA